MSWMSRRSRAGTRGRSSCGQVLAVEDDRAAGRLLQADDQPADRGLAAAGLADQAERLARADVEDYVGDRADRADLALQHRAAGHREVLHQVLGREHDSSPTAAVSGEGLPPAGPTCGRPPQLAVDRASARADREEAAVDGASGVLAARARARSVAAAVRSRTGTAARTGSRAAGRSGPAAGRGWCTAARWPSGRLLRQRAEQRLGVGVARVGEQRGVSVVSTILPAYMTATRSARPAITPRSWVTRMTAMPSRCRRSSISSRICFWIVTSSAVVGSSAISSFGSQASAIAIITRWRMPPENWCGYSSTRSAGLRHADQAEHLDGPVQGLLLGRRPRCSRTASAICSPTVIVGFSEVSGSWKIMPISLPRIWRISSSARAG